MMGRIKVKHGEGHNAPPPLCHLQCLEKQITHDSKVEILSEFGEILECNINGCYRLDLRLRTVIH